MYEEQEIQSKRSQFRNQIRRKQIQQRFQAQRMKFAEGLIREQQEEISKELDTAQKKRAWIFQKSMELGNVPTKAWYQTLRALSIGMRAFSQDSFDVWIESGLIQKILLTFKQQYFSVQLSNIGACIMQDIFYYLPRECSQINQILEYEFIIDIVELCANEETTAEFYYELISCMIDDRNYLRDKFVGNGLVQTLTCRLKRYIDGDVETDEVFCAFNVAFKLIKPYQIPGGTALVRGNVISVLIPIFDAYLLFLKREDSLRVILKSFLSLASSSKEYVIAHIFQGPNLINYLLHSLSQKGSPTNRGLIASILASILSSPNKKYSQQLIKRGILNQVLECSRLDNNLQTCLASLLQIISNSVVNTVDDARSVLQHPVFGQFVMPCANQLQYIKLHELAIYILSSLAGYQNLQMTELLLKKYNILQCFILGLNHQAPTLENCKQILRALMTLVRMYNDIYTGDVNKVTLELQRMYNINNVLASLEERIANKKLHKIIQLFVESMNKE